MTLDGVAAFLALFARVMAWANTAPLIAERPVPGRLRAAVCALVAMALSTGRAPLPFAELWKLLPSEILIGLAAGFASRLVLFGAEAAGQLIGLQLELGFAATFDPLARDESLPTRRLALALGGLAYLATGGLDESLRALALAPPGAHLAPAALVDHTVDAALRVTTAAVLGSAPVLAAALVCNLALGIAGRAAPALNVFSVVLACVLVVGALTLLATAPELTQQFFTAGRDAGEAVRRLLH